MPNDAEVNEMPERMRLDIFLPSSSRNPERLLSLAREAERLGFGALWVPDHVLKVFGPILDPLTLLAFLAGATEKITLGTSILVLPYRHPVALANAVSSLDVLSGGRLVLGVGAGWNEDEFAALGMRSRERGRRTDEGLEALRALWTGKASHDGRFYSFQDAEIGTSPGTLGGPPLLIGGSSDAALRRTLSFGSGWMGFGDPPEQIGEVRARIVRLGEEIGRDPDSLEIGTTFRVNAGEDAEGAAEGLGRLAEAGVTFCALAVSPSNTDSLRWVAEEVAPRLRGG